MIVKRYVECSEVPKKETGGLHEEGLPTKYMDGMGPATVRMIIERSLDDNVLKKYGLKELENADRYYIVKIVECSNYSFQE